MGPVQPLPEITSTNDPIGSDANSAAITTRITIEPKGLNRLTIAIANSTILPYPTEHANALLSPKLGSAIRNYATAGPKSTLADITITGPAASGQP